MLVMFVVGFFFFFKQKTAYEMRISDWSSDVCSSDLAAGGGVARIDQRLDLAIGSARLLVVLLDAGARHVDLAAHLQHARHAVAALAQRNATDGALVGGDVLAGPAVAAGCVLHGNAVYVPQATRLTAQPWFDTGDRVQV